MRQLYITFKFDIKDGTENGFYHDLADYMIDEAWDAIAGNGLDRKNTKQLREMLAEIGKPWEDVPLYQQRGVACVKNEDGWYIDESMPILKGDGRDYLERLI